MNLTPFETRNLVFIDTEFTGLDPASGELLSVGMVTLDGRELYIELASSAPRSEWVQKHVEPSLSELKFTTQQASAQIEEFIGTSNPFVVAFVDNYDIMYLTKLFGAGKLPFRWMSVDFSSILFAMGVNPVRFKSDHTSAKKFYAKLGIDLSKYRAHHALDDARLLREVWLKMVQIER